MGHYDSCREADEQIENERAVHSLHTRFSSLTFDQKLAMSRVLSDFMRAHEGAVLHGTTKHHGMFEKLYKTCRELF